jgi:hypothetical protein
VLSRSQTEGPQHEPDNSGVCYFCHASDQVVYCTTCGTWLCPACRHKYISRLMAGLQSEVRVLRRRIRPTTTPYE